MDKEIRKWIIIAGIALAVMVILLLMLSGFDLRGFKIQKGIKIN